MNDVQISKLIQLHCDGELTPEQDAAFKQNLQAHPQARESLVRQVEFHHQLRLHIAQAMQSQTSRCPEALSMSVRASLAEIEAVSQDSQLAEPAIAGQIGPDRTLSKSIGANSGNGSQRSGRSRWAAFSSNARRANFFAIAATLALIAGAVLYGIFGRTIDEVPPPRPVDLVARAAQFADQEHRNWAGHGTESLAGETRLTAPPEVEQDFEQWMGQRVAVFDLNEAGYEFIGASRCKMPVPERSGHLLYRKRVQAGERAPMISIFVVPKRGRCQGLLCREKKLGQWYPIADTKCRLKVMQSSDGKLVYFMVCCVDRDVDSVVQHIKLVSDSARR